MPDAANKGMNHNAAHDAAHKRHGFQQKRPEPPGREERENTERRPQSCLKFLKKEIITYTDQYGQNEMNLDYVPKKANSIPRSLANQAGKPLEPGRIRLHFDAEGRIPKRNA